MLGLRKFEIALIIIAILCAIASIVTWIVFPLVYPNAVASNLKLLHDAKDGSPSYSTWMWSHPPMKNVMRFFFFNITNPDEMKYYGQKPVLNEIGPFSVLESEEKQWYSWNSDDTQIYYQNFKKYLISEEDTAPNLNWDDIVTVPNPVGIGAAADLFDPLYKLTPVGITIVSTFLLLMGEYPFVSHTVREVVFDGYDDPFLSAAHSPLLAFLNGLNGGKSILPIPVPSMPLMGYFQGYNNTNDEYYWVNTGKNDVDKVGEVITWANVSILPESWWTTEYSREIRGTDAGTFSKMHLKKDDVVPNFQSFQCRSFDSTFLKEEEVHSIPSYTFSVAYDQYDTTSDKMSGFRYRNVEKVNYYPDWPSCPDRDPNQCSQNGQINCALAENLCHNCCDMSFVNGTYLVPPGIFPLVCYPGRLDPAPFSVMYSAPHYIYSPPQMINSVVGLNPDPAKHLPMLYSHEPYSGTVTKVIYNLQVNMPIMQIKTVPQLMQITESIVPIFWQGATATLRDNTYNLVWLGFVLVPKLVDGIKYGLLAFALFLLVLTAFCAFRRKKVGAMENNMLEKGKFTWNEEKDEKEDGEAEKQGLMERPEKDTVDLKL